MATVTRERKTILVNPGKRRLTPRQIKFFGTKAQRAALKRRTSAARTSRPKSHRAHHRPSAGRKNPAEIILVNPGSRSTTVRSKKKASKPRHRPAASGRRSDRTNPAVKTVVRYRTRSAPKKRKASRPNPGMRNVGGLFSQAAYAIAGAVGSKLGTQAVLGSNNNGIVGYGTNLAMAFVIGKGVGMFTKNKQAENAAILGGVIAVLVRFLADKTPLGATLKNAGLGDYQVQGFLAPQRLADGLRSAEIAYPRTLLNQMQPAALPPPVKAPPGGMAGLRTVGSSQLY